MTLSRRSFLVGAAALAVGAACSSDGDDDAASTTTSTPDDPASALALGVSFPPNGLLHTGGPQRMPFLLFVGGAPATFDDAPESLEFAVVQDPGDFDGADKITVERGGEGMPRPYYPLVATFDSPGNWFAVTEVDGQRLETAVQVSDPASVAVTKVGDQMPLIDTPTFDDPRGVNPICTREPQCPLHDVTLAAALDENSPTALLIGSPAFCQTAVCGPVLDVLLAEVDAHPGIHFLHAEVFVDPTAPQPQATDALVENGLTHEPVLFLIGADGVVQGRLDAIFDPEEVRGALASLAG